jgi:hypothetical protein
MTGQKIFGPRNIKRNIYFIGEAIRFQTPKITKYARGGKTTTSKSEKIS